MSFWCVSFRFQWLHTSASKLWCSCHEAVDFLYLQKTVDERVIWHIHHVFYFYDDLGRSRPVFVIFFTAEFKKRNCREAGIETTTSPCICCHTTLQKVSIPLYSFTAQLIQISDAKSFRCSKCSRGMLIFFVYLQINLQHSQNIHRRPLVNGCVDCELYNAVPNVYLNNWNKQNITIVS